MAATSTTSTTTQYNAIKMVLYYTVIIACFTGQFLSVNAIRCHQCNSHIDEDCIVMRLSTPRGQPDNIFLKDCSDETDQKANFCRKTVLKIDVTSETRIVRSCGWLHERSGVGNNSCFTADNEGYKQTICTCNEDGCNGSSGLHISKWSVLAMTAFNAVLAAAFRKN